MKRSFFRISAVLTTGLFLSLLLHSCKKTENPIKFQYGTFPDSVYNLDGINSQFDDYNSTCYILDNTVPVIFSSNRGSSGGQFDLVQGRIRFLFDQTSGEFSVVGESGNDPFYAALIGKANTPGNDFGPYSIFSSNDGFEYFMIASETQAGNLDLFYLRYLPYFGAIPVITGPYPINKLNSPENDAYIAFDMNQDSVYFCSDRGGDFDIYLEKRGADKYFDEWFNQAFSASTSVDSVNSAYNDKCPFVNKNLMVFASDRPGGMGGFDLYYSIFRNGKWNSPVNLGPAINSSSDEYRPLLGYHPDFTNSFLVFSSDKTGGKGGFDLYFTGLTITK